MFRPIVTAAMALALTACTQSTVVPLAGDTVQITTSAEPMCTRAGTQAEAVRRAATETLRRGFDRYVILDEAFRSDVRIVGHTPVVAQTTGTATVSPSAYGATVQSQSQTRVSGGVPIVGGSHNQAFVIRMFKDGDPLGANAISARDVLGPKWKESLEPGSSFGTCM